jgi:phytoene dehydrogenase-like protein
MQNDAHASSVAVVGGGIGGLATATYLARAGRRVTVFEKANTVGGRAVTHETRGFRLNLGPHALYCAAEGAAVLAELGVAFTGGKPNAGGGFALDRGAKHALPGGLVSLLTTGLFGLGAKLETARILAAFHKIDPAPLQATTVRAWSERHLRNPDVRRLMLALFRLATYTADPDRQSAGTAIAQLQGALRAGVRYLDGGWQTLVDGLRAQATAAGVEIRTGAGVEAVDGDGGLRLRDGGTARAATIVIAAGPDVARGLLGAAAAPARWAEAAVPVRAACLDVALARLPQPSARFALGIDEPHYLSVHSAVARLAPAGGAVVHVARYLGAEKARTPRDVERELEGVLDLVQPGWRDVLVERRFLPAMTVANALVTAASGGLAGRPGPEVPGLPNVLVVGDWVGPAGQLADATLASARQAAALITGRRAASAAAA